MYQLDKDKEIIQIEKKLVREGRENLVRELRSLSNEQRRDRLKQQAILGQEIIDNKAKASEKADMAEAISKVREHNATYREQADGCKRISRFVHLLIDESGKI
jgi:hypothetical protein